ncbi:MAG: Crp/Fnr family transcriptional regulator [Firmicutes bacterium]|nr:Crp/Fnr family transcriptional regulator [Bacillota bacterium]
MEGCLKYEGVGHVCARTVPIFANLDEEGLAKVNQLINSSSYERGEFLFNKGDPAVHLYIVRSGRVKLYDISSEGRQQIIRILHHGDFFGELTIFQATKQFCYAETMEPSDVCQLKQSDLKVLLRQEPKVALALLEAMGNRLSHAEGVISDLSLKTVEERLLSWLLLRSQTGQRQGSAVKIVLDLGREELAQLLGTTTETVSRRLNSLQEEGVLTLAGHRSLVIHDLEELAEMSSR